MVHTRLRMRGRARADDARMVAPRGLTVIAITLDAGRTRVELVEMNVFDRGGFSSGDATSGKGIG